MPEYTILDLEQIEATYGIEAESSIAESTLELSQTVTFKYHHISLHKMELTTRARKWGSSLAVILPKAVVDAKSIHVNDRVVIDVRFPLLAKDVFGLAKQKEIPTQEIKDELRQGWESMADRRRWKK